MSNQPMTIGIDHMAFYAPQSYLSLEDLAAARGIDPQKYTVGIGIREAAVAPPTEDVIVLAANAGARVLKEAGVSPAQIGLLIVGTESAEDKSKPTATQVHELLGIAPACRVYDIVHACAGATYGILSALDWLQGPNRSHALVIASDIARYGRKSLGEPTQGAGAVAMLISRSPRLLSLTEIGRYSRNVYDFWKPMESAYPIVDGIYSAQCYGEAAEACFKGLPLSRSAAYLYHVPYPKLVQQTDARISRLIGPDVDEAQHFSQKVAASCLYGAQIGNIYTGSLWLALMSFLGTYLSSARDSQKLSEEYDGCYLFSYGSGCGSALLRGNFSPTWAQQAVQFKFENYLQQRTRITMDDYEAYVEAYENPLTMTDAGLKRMPAGGPFRYLGTKNLKRLYGSSSAVTA